ncbi:unnamed protein product [Rotaria socialis]|uniref:Uncharacterized protein n=1 Tax=Rotaria socialis TaxID=392032 RepID=A0A821LTT1_9BILA|nr:unnamed protein product [Rotaria socialis]CAF3495776.1 unnamed protein product [Rotaria socialis]CAF4756808.1 unnamed protein product [Rotaria socialis]CAF4808876.1 unnamed protein product [Rotaria socialis]
MYHSKFKRSSNQTVQLKISLAYLIENIQFYTFRFRLITSADLQCMTGNLCVHLIHTVRSKIQTFYKPDFTIKGLYVDPIENI